MISDSSLYIEPTERFNRRVREERAKMRNFIFNAYDNLNSILIRNFAPSGMGKSYLLADLIHEHPMEQFVIVIPDHKMATGVGDLEDMLDRKVIRWIHIYGKTQDHIVYNKYCLRPDGEEYYPGCSFMFDQRNLFTLFRQYTTTYDFDRGTQKATCSYINQCPYKAQFNRLRDFQTIICVIEHASMFSDRVLVFDESFEQKLLVSHIVNKEQIAKYHINIENEEIVKIIREKFKFYTKVEMEEEIIINNEESYFLSRFLNSTDNINAYLIKKKNSIYYGCYCLFGIRTNYLPEYRKMIFNCATTPLSLMYKITDTEIWGELEPEYDGWVVYRSEGFDVHNLENPMIKFKHNWGKELSTKWLDKAISYFKSYGKNSLIITKKALKKKFMDQFSESKFVHFNAGRGFNRADREEGHNLIIQYGRFGFDPLTREMWKRIGFSEDLVNQMEESEMLQCLHRGRPLLHPNTPILMMSDEKLFPHKTKISVKILELFHQYYDIDMTSPEKEILERMGIKNKNKISQFKKFLHFIRKHVLKIE